MSNGGNIENKNILLRFQSEWTRSGTLFLSFNWKHVGAEKIHCEKNVAINSDTVCVCMRVCVCV